jgi:hypothetical protein
MSGKAVDKSFVVEIPVSIGAGEVIKRLKLRPGGTRREKMAAELVAAALAAARPKGIYRAAPARVIDRQTVAIDSRHLTSRALSKCLSGQSTVYPVIVTAGRELGALARPGDLLRQYWLDVIQTLILVNASEYLTDYIKAKYALLRVADMNPGEFADFPISQQRPLFALFGGAEKQIGVELTAGGVIRPEHSRSGIIFPNTTGFLSCRLCRQVKCPGRRAAYDPAAVAEYLGENA